MKKALLMAALAAAVVGGALGCGGKGTQVKLAPAVAAPDTVATVPDTKFTDKRDGKVYRIAKVGGQTWMAENLNYAAEGSVCYENNAKNCVKYGRLYDWNTAMTACPAGWHLADKDEWWTLVDYADGWVMAGKILKSTKGWDERGDGTDDDRANGTDDFGFSALPGGCGDGDGGNLTAAGGGGCWWMATEDATYGDSDNDAWSIHMTYYDEGKFVVAIGHRKKRQFSVRCVQDGSPKKSYGNISPPIPRM